MDASARQIRIAVIGAGGVGGTFGALLARAGLDVSFLVRGEHGRAIRERGLEVRSPAGSFRVAARAADDPAEIGPCDLVLFAVKTYDTGAAAVLLPGLLAPGGRVLTLQNGVESESRLRTFLPAESILPGCAYVQASRTAPGVVEQSGGPCRIVLGESGRPPGPAAKGVHALLSQSGISCEIVEDVTVALWTKFAFIAPVSGVCGVERLPIGEVIESAPTRAMLADAIREVVAVAHARRIALPPRLLERGFELASAFPHDAKPSLLHDLEAGRRLEIDALSGAVVRLGTEVGVSTPIHRHIDACLKPWDDAAARREKLG